MKFCIVGSSGQDGRILSSLLQMCNYSADLINRNSFDILDKDSIKFYLHANKPTHIIFLAAAHASATEINKIDKEQFFLTNFEAPRRWSEVCSTLGSSPWFMYPLSSKLYAHNTVINEKTEFQPSCYYGESKLLARNHLFKSYPRESLFIPVLFNHESSFRSESYLSAKIVDYFVGTTKKMKILYPNDKIDWGLATEFCNLFLEASLKRVSGECIVATGNSHTILNMLKVLSVQHDVCLSGIEFCNLDLDERCKYADVSLMKKTFKNYPRISGPGVVSSIIEGRNVV